MAKQVEEGVVNEFGQVFDARTSQALHSGLYLADAAVIPTALGVNPSLTISALALRIVDSIIASLPPA
jgi:choline dehydrogenase-like flavoprotein